MNGKQLKNSILQWAIQGKLVEQNPKDEPASKLLERIAAQKAVVNGAKKSSSVIPASEPGPRSSSKKAKSSKAPISRIYRENGSWFEQVGSAEPKDITEEIPFDIPENWEWCRFGNVVFNRDAERIPLSVDQRSSLAKLYDYYGASGVIDKVDDFLFDKPLLLIGEDGANLINRSTPIAFIAKGKYWVNNHAHVLDALNEDLLLYVCTYINSISLVDYVTGTAQPKMNQEKMNSILVALPPLAEQKRIVKKLEQILPLVEEYDSAQQQLDKLNKELPESLKKSILQQAIQGKLVPQNPNDEPAQALLDRISAERVIASGAKQSKKSSAKVQNSRIYRDTDGLWYEQIGTSAPKDITEEIPFDIPENWVWCRMGNIGSWGAGATPAKGNPEFYNNGVIPWLVTGELNNSIVTDTKVKVSQKALEKCSLRLCKPGDILIAMYGATIGKLAIAGIELTTNQACCACTLYYDFNMYLFYFLMASKTDLTKRGEGGAQPNISKEKLVNYLIPLPPLAEQKRIVTKLEELFEVV